MAAKKPPSSALLSASPAPGRRRQVAALALLLAVATVAVYSPVRHNDFVNYDDWDYVAHNQLLHQGLTPASALWAFAATDPATGRLGLNFTVGNWHPLTWLSHELDVSLFGLQPGPQHLMSLGFHALNAVLLFLLLVRLTGALWKSAIVAALFALHPLHVESVAWISERKDLLSTLFFLLTIWAYVAWTARGAWRYLLIVFLFALGLLAKPMLVTLPFVLLLLDFWPLRRMDSFFNPSPLGEGGPQGPGEGLRRDNAARAKAPPQKKRIAEPQSKLHDSIFDIQYSAVRRFFSLLTEKLPLFLLIIPSAVITWYAQKASGYVVSQEALPLPVHLLNAIAAYAVYLRQMVWPRHLMVYYPYHSTLPAGELLIAAAVLLAVTVLAVLLVRRRPYLLTGWLLYLGLLVPVIGLVQVGNQAHADRYTYLPLVGVFLMIVWGVGDLVASSRTARLAAGTLAALLLVACGALAWTQVATWKDSFTLYDHALAIDPRNAVVEDNLGGAVAARGDIAGAIPHLRRATDINPRYVDAFIHLGTALDLCGHTDEALAAYRQALALNPNSVWARTGVNVVTAEKAAQARSAAPARQTPPQPARNKVHQGNPKKRPETANRRMSNNEYPITKSDSEAGV